MAAPLLFRKKLTKGDIFIILSNLIPVYGVWFEGWSGIEVFIVYALETLIVGMLTVLKLLVMTIARKKDIWYNNGSSSLVSGLFFIAFFILHFGIFAAVQTTIFSQAADITPPGSHVMHFFFNFYEYINEDVGIMLAGFVVSYLVRSFVPFIVNGDYQKVPMMRVMFEPYGRIFIQQFTVILGSMFLTFGGGKAFILIFAVAKICFEVYANFDSVLDKAISDMKKDSPQQ